MSAVTDSTETINSTLKPAPALIFGLTSSAWDKTLIASLIVAAIAAVAVGFSTAASIIAHQQETLEADASLERYKEVAAAKIAEARTEGIKAGKAAGDAIVQAGEANERAGKANEAAAKANERASEIEKEAREAQERTAALNLRIEAMKLPRLISESQAKTIVSVCKEYPRTRFDIVFNPGDEESQRLMISIADLLSLAKWNMIDLFRLGAAYRHPNGKVYSEATSTGLNVLVHSQADEQLKQAANAIVKVFNENGFAMSLQFENWPLDGPNSPGLSPEILHIFVGRKQ